MLNAEKLKKAKTSPKFSKKKNVDTEELKLIN